MTGTSGVANAIRPPVAIAPKRPERKPPPPPPSDPDCGAIDFFSEVGCARANALSVIDFFCSASSSSNFLSSSASFSSFLSIII